MADRPSALVVVAASLRRSFAAQTAEALPNVIYLLSLGIGLSSQIFFAKLVDAAPNPALGSYQGHFAVYLLAGVSLLDLQNAVVGGLGKAIRDAQLSGSLEAMLVTPTPRGVLLFALTLPAVLGALMRMVLYAALAALVFGLSFENVNVLGVVVVLVFAQASFFGFALVGAGLTMLLRRGDPVSRLIAALSIVSGGVFYPAGILPRGLADAGRLLPILPALTGLREAVLRGAGPGALRGELLMLGASVVLVVPIGAWFFARMVARARQDGSMTAW